jgi:hypothetical protein
MLVLYRGKIKSINGLSFYVCFGIPFNGQVRPATGHVVPQNRCIVKSTFGELGTRT